MRKQKRQNIIMILAVLVALTLCGCTRSTESGIVQSRRGTGKKVVEATEQMMEESDTESEEASEVSDLYIITKIDTKNKVAVFQKVSNGRQSQYSYDTGTRFLDKYGDMKAITSFLPGDVAKIEVIQSTQVLDTVQLSSDVWVQEDIVNYSVDESIHAITIGQTRYSYDSDMDIFSDDKKIGFSSVGGSDVLRAVGMDKKIISLAVTKGHGYLKLANTTIFEGSFICVGDKIFEEVTKNMQIEVPEGKYLVTVANNGYGGSREVTITRDQTTSLNLNELKGEGPKVCKITFDVGVEGAVLRIDGNVADYSKPVEVQYGVHTISVEAEGFDTITEKLVVNSKEAEIEIALTSSTGKSDAEDNKTENATNNSNGNNNSNSNNNSNNSNNTNNNNNTNNTNNNNSNNNNTNNTNNNNSNNNDTNNSNGTNNDSSSTDYLTTLYNLLTSINNSNNGNTSSSNTGNSYEDLSDG